MPPKASQKAKAEPAKAPRSNQTETPKKPKSPTVFNRLGRDPGAAIPIDVSYEGQALNAKTNKSGAFTHAIKFEAPNPFALVKTVVLTEGPYEGHQAILLRPARAFPFKKLPRVVRALIYNFYFAPKGVVSGEIVLEGKRTSNKELYAKTYAEGSKDRVGLLAVNKEIHDEAVQIFYAHIIKLESTTTLLDFLGQLLMASRKRLSNISIKSYVKTSSRNAMHFLAESANITQLHIETGISSGGDPVKAAKAFYGDAYKFLEAVGAAKGNKTSGVDVLSFGKKAFTIKDDKNNQKPWSDELIEEFKDNLKAKLK